jgi:uroporphyrinogen decarboxylase
MTAIAHKEPDRVPIDFGGMRSTGIMAIAYNKLKAHLGLIGGETRVYDTMQAAQLNGTGHAFDLLSSTGSTLQQHSGLPPSDKYGSDWLLPDGSPGKIPDGVQPRLRQRRLGGVQPRNDHLPDARCCVLLSSPATTL